MPWAAITSDDIRTGLSGAELEVLQSIGLVDGQADPLPEVIQQVTDEIRGYIAANGQNTLGLAGTLPAQVKAAAIAIVRWRYAGRLASGKAGELLRSETRRQDYEEGMRLLKDISNDKFAIEQPAADEVGPETMAESEGRWGSEEKQDFSAI